MLDMTPVVPLSGYPGWRFLSKTQAAQLELVASSPQSKRETDQFRERIAAISSAEALVKDRSLLKVALGAFGLEADLPNRAFIQRVLESPSQDPGSLANRLADKRYLEFARAFGFAEPGGPFSRRPGFADRIVKAYQTRTFEAAVGERDESMRLALTAVRELSELSQRKTTPDSKWFAVMGNPPLRRVFESALGLPTSFGALDLDRQLDVLREKTRSAFGNGEITQFASAERREDLVRLFLVRSDVQQSSVTSGGSVALALLQSVPRPFLRL